MIKALASGNGKASLRGMAKAWVNKESSQCRQREGSDVCSLGFAPVFKAKNKPVGHSSAAAAAREVVPSTGSGPARPVAMWKNAWESSNAPIIVVTSSAATAVGRNGSIGWKNEAWNAKR